MDGSENEQMFSQVMAEEVEEDMTESEESDDESDESPDTFVRDDLDPFCDL